MVIKGESECEKSYTMDARKEHFLFGKWKDLHKLIGSYIINNYINMNE